MNLGGESELVEFKRSTSEMREGMESIASILNKHGEGDLYFGVRNNGEVIGQDVSEKTLRDVSQAVGNRIEPRIYPTIEELHDNEGHAYIHVAFVGLEPPYACDGRYRIRSADEDVPMSQEELARQFSYARARKEPWDTWESERPISDVDEEELRAYVTRGNECGRIPFVFTSVENVLSRLGLIRNGKLTNAAEILFCPSRFVRLKMGMLATHARTEILDLHQMEGTLFSLVREAEWYVLNHTRRRFVIEGFGPRKEIPEIPREAVREILFNAFTHRDWLSNASVQIDIYHDAVEICNPGWFIEGQDPAEHLAGNGGSSLSRNMLIARTIYRCGDVEAYGSGIPRVRDLCVGAGIHIEYVRTSWGTKFIFHRNDAFGESNGTDGTENGTDGTENGTDGTENGTDGTENSAMQSQDKDLESFVLDLLSKDPTMTVDMLSEKIGKSRRQVLRMLSSLRKGGKLERVGPNRGGQWHVLL